MRIVISIAALLMILALAAFGIISAQKVSAGSQTTASVSSATAGSQSAEVRRNARARGQAVVEQYAA